MGWPIDPQSQGREATRAYLEGGDASQARQDQGCPREETGACYGEEECIDWRARGGEEVDWRLGAACQI